MKRFVDFLVTYQNDKVLLCWNHLVAFPVPQQAGRCGSYGFSGASGVLGSQGAVGAMGAQGCMGTTGAFGIFEKDGIKYTKRCAPRTAMPDVLQFTAKFIDETDFIHFSNLLKETCPDVTNLVQLTFLEPKPIKRQLRLKEQFVAIQQREQEQEKEDLQKAVDLIQQAEALGYHVGDAEFYSKRPTAITSECYEEFGEQNYTNSEINILCHKDSEIYKELDSAGLLQKYCPESYRRGDGYSVNGGKMHEQPVIDVPIE